uniref:Secreted protein n=2 Tax=Oryza brachyantha TaxID=4533 RepID=J3LCZ4_ORYBR
MAAIGFSLLLAAAALLAMWCSDHCSGGFVVASDPSPLQDLCVADRSFPVRVNSVASCKDTKDVATDDFFFSGLHVAGNATSKQGSAVTAVNVA